eukprot:6191656-Pleurochrysis_carterae.AAC.1
MRASIADRVATDGTGAFRSGSRDLQSEIAWDISPRVATHLRAVISGEHDKGVLACAWLLIKKVEHASNLNVRFKDAGVIHLSRTRLSWILLPTLLRIRQSSSGQRRRLLGIPCCPPFLRTAVTIYAHACSECRARSPL